LVIEIGQIIHDFAIIMIVAAVMSLLSYKLKQPMVIGYIIAGMIIGPFTFNFIFNVEVLNLLAEIGVVLLLLVVGMEFPLEKLRKIGRKAFVIAVSEALGTFVGGYAVAHYALNFSFFDSLFLALAISVTSSVLVMRVLEELNVIREESSLLILGVCVIEDIVFALSYIAYEIGISIATGAFFAGVLIAGSKVQVVTKVMATPIRDMFAALFFVSVGALMDITLLPIFIIPSIILILVSVGAKLTALYMAARSQGFDRTTSIRAAFSLSSSFLSPYLIKVGWNFRDLVKRGETM
jgi:CPA2 family monovalent cation:H+ antiporter-2